MRQRGRLDGFGRHGFGRHGIGPARIRGRAAVLAGGLAVLLACFSSLTLPAVAATSPAGPSDFNGDGYADLVVSASGEALGRVSRAGLVEVIYGSSSGLASSRSQAWTRNTAGVKGVASPGDRFGIATASGDFDGDGYADLAIGALGGDVGTVTVLYGSRSGLTARDQLLKSADVGRADYWGPSLAAGDFNGDGRADLALGADPASPSEHEQVGAVTVLYGSGAGLSTGGSTRITKDTAGIAGTSAIADAFGYRLASGDVNGDGRDDLALSSRITSGTGQAAYLLFGSSGGITPAGSQHFDAATPGITPPNTRYTGLGGQVALGDFDDDGHAELVLTDFDAGPPGSTDCIDEANCPGAVVVLRGTATGATTTGLQLWYQDAPGVPGASEGGDGFGAEVATGDLNGDGRADLVVGVPGESLGSITVAAAGAVNVFYGTAQGLTAERAQTWNRDSAGIKGQARDYDLFGGDLRIANFGGGAAADLAVSGAGLGIGPDVGEGSGEVNVLYGSAAGVSDRDQLWSQDSPGIAGRAEAGDQFRVQ